jgi:competence protein ComFB
VSTHEFNVTNANHERVLAVMDKLLTERYADFCACTRCKCDIAAIALNYLPPHYIVETEAGKEHGSPWVMVESAVTEAIDRVMENPNHPRSKPSASKPDRYRTSSFMS